MFHGIKRNNRNYFAGVFHSKFVNAVVAYGLFHGGTTFFTDQVVVVIGAAVYAFMLTYGMLFVINL